MFSDKLKLAGLILGWLLVVGLLGVQLANAWTPPSQEPPGGNTPEPLHIGDEDQYKTGSLTLGVAIAGLGELNVCGSGDSCELCLNGDCIDEWPGGGPGGDAYWGFFSNYIYPKVVTDITDVKIYNDTEPDGLRIYVHGDTTAIKAETLVNAELYPEGSGAVLIRDDNIAPDNDTPVWGVLGMAGGTTSSGRQLFELRRLRLCVQRGRYRYQRGWRLWCQRRYQ